MNQGIILSVFLLHISYAIGIRISQEKCLDYEAIVASSQSLYDSSENADTLEFPFMAKIVDYPYRYYNGLLISENFILTVRHMDLSYLNNAYVILGEYVSNTDVTHQRFSIIEYLSSPKIDPDNPDNLTLLKLNASVEFNQYVRPVCLSQPDDNITQPLLEVSWGIYDMLRKQPRDLLTNDMCNEAHRDDPAGPTRMCASRNEDGCVRWEEISRVSHRYADGCALLNGRRTTGGHYNELVAIKPISAQGIKLSKNKMH